MSTLLNDAHSKGYKEYDAVLDKAINNGIVTIKPYTWFMETINRKDKHNGTTMPLTAMASSMELKVHFLDLERCLQEGEWCQSGYELEGIGFLSPIGREIFELLKKPNILERTRCGTLATWALRDNERRRQLYRIKLWSQRTDLLKLKEFFLGKLPGEIDIFIDLLDEIINAILSVKDEDLRRIIAYYIVSQDKDRASILPQGAAKYMDLLLFPPNVLREKFVKIYSFIREHFYSDMRIDWEFIVSALRNRPEDLISVSITETDVKLVFFIIKGLMFRSREANGQPPESNVWALIYLMKDQIIEKTVHKLLKYWGVKVHTPFTDPEFYLHFMSGVVGEYAFGDNLLFINEDGSYYMTDLSMSDVLQAWLRRDEKGRNFCIFQMLDWQFDCGSTGDAFTSIWNISGLFGIIAAFHAGVIPSHPEVRGPYLPDVMKPSSTFLGMHYDLIRRVWTVEGLKITKDASHKSIATRLRTGGADTKIEFPRGVVDQAGICELIVAYSLSTEKSRLWFEQKVVGRRLIYEGIGAIERIGELLEQDHSIIKTMMQDSEISDRVEQNIKYFGEINEAKQKRALNRYWDTSIISY